MIYLFLDASTLSMAAKRLILFSAFANDSAYRLRLEQEDRILRDALSDLDRAQRLEYKSIGQASLEDLYSFFNNYHNQVAIFHFGGHSEGEDLLFRDGPASARFFSVLMGQQRRLKLVFLNGCSNQEQVEHLLQRKVPAVIATSSKVDDKASLLLANQFYLALSSGKTIQESFDLAASFVMQKHPEQEIRFRGLDLRSAKTSDSFSWGLYAGSSQKALQWRIPRKRRLGPVIAYAGFAAVLALAVILYLFLPKTPTRDPEVSKEPSVNPDSIAMNSTAHDSTISNIDTRVSTPMSPNYTPTQEPSVQTIRGTLLSQIKAVDEVPIVMSYNSNRLQLSTDEQGQFQFKVPKEVLSVRLDFRSAYGSQVRRTVSLRNTPLQLLYDVWQPTVSFESEMGEPLDSLLIGIPLLSERQRTNGQGEISFELTGPFPVEDIELLVYCPDGSRKPVYLSVGILSQTYKLKEQCP